MINEKKKKRIKKKIQIVTFLRRNLFQYFSICFVGSNVYLIYAQCTDKIFTELENMGLKQG